MKFFNNPYKGWRVDESGYPKDETFEKRMEFLLGFAVLAPSTFNSQPWKAKIAEDGIEVYLDLKRITKKSDKTGRFAHISIGCFLENLLVAASHLGFRIALKFDDQKPKEGGKFIAKVKVNEGKNKNDDESDQLFKAIISRATNRSLSLKRPIPEEILERIKKYTEAMQRAVVLGKEFSGDVIAVSLIGDLDIWTDYEFRKEHVAWVRHNLTRKYDGMPGFGVGVGLIPSFFAYPAILSPIFPKIQSKKNVKALENSANYIVLCGRDVPLEWVKLGMTYEKIVLYLASKGIAAAPMGQFIESDMARSKLGTLIEGESKLAPQLFFRIGYPSKGVRHSPRLPVEQIIFS